MSLEKKERGMAAKRLADLLRDPGFKVGSYHGEFISPSVGQLALSANCDFVMIDMEHSGFGFETLKTALRHVHDAGLASLVRTPGKDYHFIARCCDMGAQGIMPPMMETAAQASDVVRSAKYPPRGIRGAAFGIAHDDYAPGAMREKMDAANARTCIIAMIETALGVENVDEIAAVDGVDCLWIGPADLSCSLGVAGAFDHPLFTAAVEAIRRAARAHGKPLGCPLRNGEDAALQKRAGVSLGTFSADVALLRTALAAGVAEIRGKVAKV